MNKLISVLTVFVLATVVVYADPVTVPNTFTAGTPAKASEVNANFTALASAVNDAPKPLMVYDSTGKVVGSYFIANWSSVPEEFVFIRTATISFSTSFDYEHIGSANQLGFFMNKLYYTSEDCSGNAYLKSMYSMTYPSNGFSAKYAMNFAVILDDFNPNLLTVGGGQPLGGGFHSEKNLNFNGYQQAGCNQYPTTGTSYPVIGTFDLSTLNLTPPFSVH